jgi:hypothetical protein
VCRELTSTRAAVEAEQHAFHDKFDKVKAHVKVSTSQTSYL